MKNIEKIKEVLKGAISDKNYVESLFLNGSPVAGTDSEKSDIDFMLLVKNRQDIKKAINHLRSKFKFKKLESEYPYHNLELNYDGRTLDISIFEKAVMDRFVRNLYRSKSNFMKFQDFIQHKIVDAVPVHDPKNILDKYRNKISVYPEKIRKAVFSESLDELNEIFSMWVEDGFRNKFQFIEFLSKIQKFIFLAIYSNNRKFCMYPYKRAHKDLLHLKPNIKESMEYLASGLNTQNNIEQKRKILKSIITKLEKSFKNS
ncbi:MAG: nucleotidyltransferase domain-containing protein [Candidatus Pacearchaeota archaeon]